MSEWQMPQNLMSMRTSRGPTARRWISSAPSGASGAWAAMARAVVVSGAASSEVVSVMPPTVEPSGPAADPDVVHVDPGRQHEGALLGCRRGDHQLVDATAGGAAQVEAHHATVRQAARRHVVRGRSPYVPGLALARRKPPDGLALAAPL